MKTQSIRVRMTEKERNDLDNLAKKLCMTRSELVREFLAMGIHKQDSVQFVKWDNATIMEMCIRDRYGTEWILALSRLIIRK